MTSYLYVNPNLREVAVFNDVQLESFSERHHFEPPELKFRYVQSVEAELRHEPVTGVLLALDRGLPGRRQLQLLRHCLKQGRAAFVFWPSETAVECVDRIRLSSFWRHWLAFQTATRCLQLIVRWRARRTKPVLPQGAVAAAVPTVTALMSPFSDFKETNAHLHADIEDVVQIARKLAGGDERLRQLADRDPQLQSVLADLRKEFDALRASTTKLKISRDSSEAALDRARNLVESELIRSGVAALNAAPVLAVLPTRVIDSYQRRQADLLADIRPVPFTAMANPPTEDRRIPGTGAYLRTDYWAQLVSGGSYGHTCYVAKELAKLTERFVCLMPNRYALLDELGLHQVVVRPPIMTSAETDLMMGDEFYAEPLRARLEVLRPAYIYERICLANFVGARLSRDLGIPYIVEYNGSEIAMQHSFGGGGLQHEALLIEAENLAFRQATCISVISDHVRDDVVSRGIDPVKVLVNPNGVDCDEYSPPTAEQRREVRAELGLPEQRPVVGFIGTFGGWHGIDVLAEALPEICRQAPEAMFLLIGDGNLKPLVTDVIRTHNLRDRVVDVGRTKQREGARYLKAADVYVSPHSSHMRGSPFFGSPTKLFEYMALGGGIVASDLEQIGTVMSPALRPHEFRNGAPRVDDQRGVLCQPGDVQEFIEAVLGLIRCPDVSAALGRNARQAALDHFSWAKHVGRTWEHVLAANLANPSRSAAMAKA